MGAYIYFFRGEEVQILYRIYFILFYTQFSGGEVGGQMSKEAHENVHESKKLFIDN